MRQAIAKFRRTFTMKTIVEEVNGRSNIMAGLNLIRLFDDELKVCQIYRSIPGR